MIDSEKVAAHYERGSLVERLETALDAVGLGSGTLSPLDLASLDQFHSRGLAATVEIAQALDIPIDARVLDIGCGLGGPSRYLASVYGCHVTGVDLTPSFVEAARYLAERTALTDRVSYDCGNALALPYPSESFDVVMTQHVAMNIADRAGFYAEARRVLRPGGRLAIYDVVAGSHGPLHFPVPWSAVPETSFLLNPEAMRTVLTDAGFRVLAWIDRTGETLAWLAEQQRQAQQSAAAPPALGLHIVAGPDFGMRVANLGLNLREGRAGVLEAIAERD